MNPADACWPPPGCRPLVPDARSLVPDPPLVLEVAGIPRSRPRARHAARIVNKKAVSFTYHPKARAGGNDPYSKAWAAANRWYDAVQTAFYQNRPKDAPWGGPIFVSADVYLPRPKAYCRKKDPRGPIWADTAASDRDNLEKSITDALKAAGAFRDDRQVVDGAVRKMFHEIGAGPGVVVTVRRIESLPD